MAAMVFVSFIWPLIERFIEKIQRTIQEKNRVRFYKSYIKGKRQVLEEAKNSQKSALLFNMGFTKSHIKFCL